jgi:hypothetical protein
VSGCTNLTGSGLETAAFHLRLSRLEADNLPGAGDGVAAVIANMPLRSAETDEPGWAIRTHSFTCCATRFEPSYMRGVGLLSFLRAQLRFSIMLQTALLATFVKSNTNRTAP